MTRFKKFLLRNIFCAGWQLFKNFTFIKLVRRTNTCNKSLSKHIKKLARLRFFSEALPAVTKFLSKIYKINEI